MNVAINPGRLEALSAFLGAPGFNGWATLIDSTTGVAAFPVPVGAWTRIVDERGIADTANLRWVVDSPFTYDAWGLAISSDALPFIRLPLGQRRAVIRGETVEMVARLAYFDLESA